MEGVTIIKDETTNKRYAQIDLEILGQTDSEELMDLIETIIAESRKDDELISNEEATKYLQQIGKL